MAKRRVKKPDTTALRRMMGSNVTSEATYRKIQNYLTEYDRVVSDYERRWGVERLPNLVLPELRDRFWQQMDKLNDAIHRDAAVDVEHHVAVTLRAYAALEKEAIALGGKEIGMDVWTAHADGKVIAIARDEQAVTHIKKDMPDALVYCVQEVAVILAKWSEQAPVVAEVKDMFPGAVVSDVKPTLKDKLDDEIPF
jgi:hypothetical protein